MVNSKIRAYRSKRKKGRLGCQSIFDSDFLKCYKEYNVNSDRIKEKSYIILSFLGLGLITTAFTTRHGTVIYYSFSTFVIAKASIRIYNTLFDHDETVGPEICVYNENNHAM